MSSVTNVMIAGIGGASLGTELLKALKLARRYRVFGCDISPFAFGLHDPGFEKTYRVSKVEYVTSVIEACVDAKAAYLIPGGEQPMALLNASRSRLSEQGIALVSNDSAVVQFCSNKIQTFDLLAANGVAIPRTATADSIAAIQSIGLPCIIKPATNSGGSANVFIAGDSREALIYADLIARTGAVPIAQEYIPDDDGEFTVGVLSYPDGQVHGSIALRRSLDSKLSVLTRNRHGVISTGYSQGYIAEFPDVRRQCERIAELIGSKGPLNIQGRVKGNVFFPFEINPRFSASTHLRALAGFNEVDAFLQFLITGQKPLFTEVREGWYLRSLTELYVSGGRVES